VTVEVRGRDFLREQKMGAFAAVAQGSDVEPALIVLRYDGEGATGPVLGLIGKAVTFDTGGISIKPAAKMHEMKFDMSGGAAVVQAVGAIARLGLPVRVIGVVGATENMPSGHAMRPGDIVTASNGTTIEINNTDAEGRLVLADCMTHAISLGAERLVDIATLTGGIVTALGSAFAGVMSNDDAWCAAVESAGTRTGERVWRLPLDPEYDDAIKGQYGDIVNATADRKAHPITAAAFIARFADGRPWAHVDMAGVGNDAGKPYAAKGGTGFGVRLLVDIARGVGEGA
jgi:leucyl aminopeptidase